MFEIDYNTRFIDILIILATFFGPIIVIKIQKWIERKREKRQREIQIFDILMATRADRYSSSHVEALNLIPVRFYKNKKINESYKHYVDSLYERREENEMEALFRKRIKLFYDLLYSITNYLKFDFTREEIEKYSYIPEGYARESEDNYKIKQGIIKLLEGNSSISIDVKDSSKILELINKSISIQEENLYTICKK